MTTIGGFKSLKVYPLAYELAMKIIEISKNFMSTKKSVTATATAA